MILKKYNAKIKFANIKKYNELRGDVLVKSSKLKPITSPVIFILVQLMNIQYFLYWQGLKVYLC